MSSRTLTSISIAAAAVLAAWSYTRIARARRRKSLIPPSQERVLIIGASSGVGHALALQYAARGARVCVVARRDDDIAKLAADCGPRCFWVAADFSQVENMINVRDRVLREWNGLDTIHVCAGVSALQPVMALTGQSAATSDAERRGIQRAVDIAGAAIKGNFDGPLVSALTFIPLLIRTSPSPSILLLNSLASVIPAPTRALYASTKASSLLLYQALSIEHPEIAFTFLLPATIEGNFRASAVDGGPVRELDPNQHGLKRDYVARRCMDAVDQGVTKNVILPWFPYTLGVYMYSLWPSLVERQARRKYNFP